MDIFGEVELTVVREYNALVTAPFPVLLAENSTVDLASVTLDLDRDPDGVLLMATVNWSAAFAFDVNTEVLRNGSVTVTFELLRDGDIIYRVIQTARQKDFDETFSIPETLTTFEIAKLLHLDTFPLSGSAGITTYTLRATNITIVPPQARRQEGSSLPTVTAAAGAVTLVAQELEGCSRVFNGVERVFVEENVAPLPVNQPFPQVLLPGSTVDLATIDIGLGCDKDGILLLAVVNWSFQVSSNISQTTVAAAGFANVTFELLRNGTVIYRTTQTAVQANLDFGLTREVTTFAIAELQHFDIPSEVYCPGINTYTLRATNITIIPPTQFDGEIILTTIRAGAVTLVAEEIEASCKKHREVK